MKKKNVILLAVGAVVLGCVFLDLGSGDKKSDTPTPDAGSDTALTETEPSRTTETETAAPTPAETAASGSTGTSSTGSSLSDLISGLFRDGLSGGSKTETKKGVQPFTIDEQICFEQSGVRVTAVSAVSDSFWGEGIRFLIENNNSSSNISVSLDELIVNDCMTSDLFVSSVAAGKKANETLYFSDSDLKEAGITDIAHVELYFRLYDSDTYRTIADIPCVTIRTAKDGTVSCEPDDSGDVIYDQGGVRIIGKGIEKDIIWGTTIRLMVENHSGQNITVSSDDVSINDFMVSGFMVQTVFDGKYGFDEILLSSESLKENGITDIDSIEFSFHIYNPDNLRTIADTGAITYQPK